MRALGSSEDDREQRHHHREGKQVGDPFSHHREGRGRPQVAVVLAPPPAQRSPSVRSAGTAPAPAPGRTTACGAHALHALQFCLADTSHSSSRLAFSSAKAVVALKISTKIEISAAIQPPPGPCALASTVWMTSAPRSPVRSRSCEQLRGAPRPRRRTRPPPRSPGSAWARASTIYSASAAPLLDARRSDHWLMESISNPPISEDAGVAGWEAGAWDGLGLEALIVGTDAARRNLPFAQTFPPLAGASARSVRGGGSGGRARGARCDPRAQSPGRDGARRNLKFSAMPPAMARRRQRAAGGQLRRLRRQRKAAGWRRRFAGRGHLGGIAAAH